MKLAILALFISSTVFATPAHGPGNIPPPNCAAQPGTQLVSIDQTSTGVVAERARITVLTNGVWHYDVEDAHGNFQLHRSGCLEPTKLAELTATTWMSDLSALAAQLEDPGPIARSPGKPVR